MYTGSMAGLPKSFDDAANLPRLIKAYTREAFSARAKSEAFAAHATALKAQAADPAAAQAASDAHRAATAPILGYSSSDAIDSPALTHQHATARAKFYDEQANILYAKATAAQSIHKAGLSTFGKLKPAIMQTLFGTVVAAEIISIPVLLMSCVTMTKSSAKPVKPGSTAN